MIDLLSPGPRLRVDLSPVFKGLGTVNDNVLGTAAKVEELGVLVSEISLRQSEMNERLCDLAKRFQDYLEYDLRAGRLARAKADLQQLTQESEQRFGRHQRARRAATGVVRALDAETGDRADIRELCGAELLLEGAFWLPAALRALGAWICDERALAERAIEEANRRDPAKTALFFALLSRRFERHQAMSRWLERYFESQSPRQLTRDVVVMIGALASGVFGAAALERCTRVCQEWLEELRWDPEFREAQVKRWGAALGRTSPAVAPEEFTHLRAASPTWPRLERTVAEARRPEVIRQFLDDVLTGDLPVPVGPAAGVDHLLESLVNDHDADELPVQRELNRLRTLIECEGDVAAAGKRLGTDDAAYAERQDFASLLSSIAMSPVDARATEGAQRFALALSRDFVSEAIDVLAAESRAMRPARIELKIGDWQGATAGDVDATVLEDSLRAHHRERAAGEPSARPGVEPVHWLALLGLAGLVAWVGVTSSTGLVLTGLGVVIAAGIFLRHRNGDATVVAARSAALERDLQQLRNALADLADLRREVARRDPDSEALRQFVEGLGAEQCLRTAPKGFRSPLVASPALKS